MALRGLFKRKVTSMMSMRRDRRESTTTSSVSAGDEDAMRGPQVVLENTYQLEPKEDQRFPTKKAEDILKDTFLSHLLDTTYNNETCKNLTTQITETVKTQVKQELGANNRFKVVVMVMIGGNEGQGARVASRCLWYPQVDRFAHFEYHNESLFAVGIVYGVYYE